MATINKIFLGKPNQKIIEFCKNHFSYSARSYIQNGLIAQWDGIENAGYGISTRNGMIELLGSGNDFSGSTDGIGFISKATSAIAIENQPLTVEITFKCLDDNTGRKYVLCGSKSNISFGICHYTDYICYANRTTETNGMVSRNMYFSKNLDYSTSVVYDSNGKALKSIINGNTINLGSGDASWSSPSDSRIYIGNTGYEPSETKVYSIRLYSRTLSDLEILHNQSIDRLRFLSTKKPARRISYIESHGNEWIETNLIPNGNYTIETKVSNVAARGFIFGVDSGWGVNQFSCYIYHNTPIADIVNVYHTSNKYSNSFKQAGSIIRLDKGSLSVDGVIVSTIPTAAFTSGNTLSLFALKRNGVINERISARMEYLKIWNNSNLIADFIPVLDEDGVACLYDNITKHCFYTPNGAFTYN